MDTLSERDVQILTTLKRMDYMTAHQIACIFELTLPNTRRILRRLHLFLNVFQESGVNIYYLNDNGREVVQCPKVRKKLSTVGHYLMRTDLYIFLNQPTTWRNEVELVYTFNKNDPNSKKIITIPDAYYSTYTLNGEREFIIEIDHTQRMYKNKNKIERYRELMSKQVFKSAPKFIWVTTTPQRKQTLLNLHKGLDVSIYLRSDLQ